MENKFHFECRSCGNKITGFTQWFSAGQKCPKCSDSKIYVRYSADKQHLVELIKSKEEPKSLWHYFDFLPLKDVKNIVSEGEGVVPIERWSFLEEFAQRKYQLSLKVYINRNDKSFATGTFKDKGGSLAASVLKEEGQTEYVVASTGNTASAFAHYLAKAKISCSIFVPEVSLPDSEAHISTYGQKLYRVKGDYAKAKKIAAAYAKKYSILMTGGNLDPLRLEAKKTQVFEMHRLMPKMPDVYIQALSGGTGPFAVEKAYAELEGTEYEAKLPRFLLSQGNLCAPMAHAWKKAKAANFPDGYEKEYPIYDNPQTLIPTIATGNPGMYPLMAPLVKKSGGEIFEIDEKLAVHIARLVAYEKVVKIGPASAAGIAGFFEALKNGFINNNETVFINIGESANRALSFMQETAYGAKLIDSVEECERFDRAKYKEQIWKPFEKM